MTSLEALLAGEARTWVLHDDVAAAAARELSPRAVGLDSPAGTCSPDAVILVTTDRHSLRAAAARLPALPAVTSVGCLLTGDPVPLALRARPDWPSVRELDAVRLSEAHSATTVTLASSLGADVVLRELARESVPATGSPLPDRVDAGAPDPATTNPIGFRADADGPMADLRDRGDRVGLEGLPAHHDLARLREVVAVLRDRRGVRVHWDRPTPALAAAVIDLAMAGVPVVGDAPPAVARPWLRPGLHEVLSATAQRDGDLDDAVRREEVSIAQRRTALTLHGPRSQVTYAGGGRFPPCSVVLCTRRPEQLDFAVRQVLRQRGLDVELVVVGHGFEPDRARIHELLGARPHQVLSHPSETPFGAVLDAGVEAASGEVVVKMDDDDWYGPDFLLDLMLAREYSGAELVGAPAEFVYVQQVDRTVRTHAGGEQFARLVAGGTIALPRDLLHELGGFRPVRRFVDRQLLDAAAAAGVRVYRGHGLGYLLRRTSSGHTWDPGLDFFLDPERIRQQWQGFAPTAVHDVDARDAPVAGDRSVDG